MGHHQTSPGKEHKSEPEITKMCQRQQDAGALQQFNDTSVQTAVISDPRSGVKESCCSFSAPKLWIKGTKKHKSRIVVD